MRDKLLRKENIRVSWCRQQRQPAAADRINTIIYWYHISSQTLCDICLGSPCNGVAEWPLMFLSNVCRRCICDVEWLPCRPIL